MVQFDFKGRVAVVTGGARGIARAVADRLLASGATVVIWDIREPADSTGPFGAPASAFHFHKVDVTDEAGVADAARAALAIAGRVDIVINGAGVTGPTMPVESFPFEQWKRIVSINLDSVFLVSRAFIPAMKQAGYGRIVSIASVAGKQGNPQMAGYSAAKGGVIAFTKALGLELAGSGVLVNCVTPGLVATELLAEMSDEAIALSRSKIPLNRLGTVEEIAATIAWAASDESSFTTGAAFDLSGGRSSY